MTWYELDVYYTTDYMYKDGGYIAKRKSLGSCYM